MERVVEIGEYVALDSPAAAANLVEELFGSVQRLARFPASGRRVPESQRSDLREVVHGNFRVIYRLDTEQVVVLTVRHSRQELRSDDPEIQ